MRAARAGPTICAPPSSATARCSMSCCAQTRRKWRTEAAGGAVRRGLGVDGVAAPRADEDAPLAWRRGVFHPKNHKNEQKQLSNLERTPPPPTARRGARGGPPVLPPASETSLDTPHALF